MFSIKHAKCPKCNKEAGPIDFLAHHIRKRWYKLWGGKKNVYKTKCPACKNYFPLDATECSHCKTNVALFPLFFAAARPYIKMVVRIKERVERISAAEAFLIRLSYFVGSVLVVLFLVNKIESEIERGNIMRMMIAAFASLFYIAVSLLAFSWILPKDIAATVTRLKPILKISFAVNYLSLVLMLILISDLWATKAWILIATFFVTILAVWFSGTFGVSAWMDGVAILSGMYAKPRPERRRGREDTHRPNQLD